MRDRRDAIRIYRSGGILDLREMRTHYDEMEDNNFPDGGLIAPTKVTNPVQYDFGPTNNFTKR